MQCLNPCGSADKTCVDFLGDFLCSDFAAGLIACACTGCCSETRGQNTLTAGSFTQNETATVERALNTELQAILKDKAVQEQLAQVGFEVWPTATPAEFATYVKDQMARWGRLVKQAGIEAQ